MNPNNVTCTAPLTSILIDTNKGVRPCCVYEKYIGNLKTEDIVSITNNEEWKSLKQQMYDNTWPSPCLACKEREELSGGWSVRTLYRDTFDVAGWEEEKLTYLEFNGSNICNLACLHCTPGFSSRWVTEQKKVIEFVENTYDFEQHKKVHNFDIMVVHDNDVQSRSPKMHMPDPKLVLENLKLLDLAFLKTINLKGGEPFLNSETTEILKFLDEQSLLPNIKVHVSTNGTYINDEILNLLKKCKKVNIFISVDGTDELFNYIRYGNAKFNDIEPVVARINDLDNVSIEFQCSVMNYNIFRLLDIRIWSNNLRLKYNKISEWTGFTNCVQSPEYLSIRTLSDASRQQLANFYKDYNERGEFNNVISTLESSYIGDKIHNSWIDYTNLMQSVRHNDILSIVPELTNELTYK